MFDEIAAALAHGEAVALLTVVRVSGAAPCPPGTQLFTRADGALSGSLGGASLDSRASEDALRLLRAGKNELLTYHLDPDTGESVGSCGATVEVFIQSLRPEPRLFIAGSGYVAQALARLAAPLGWRIALVDDRSEFANTAVLPEHAEVAVADIAAWLRERHADAMSAIVIVTRGHRADEEALRAALESDAGYIGMIGSPSKVRAIFRRLLRAGILRSAAGATSTRPSASTLAPGPPTRSPSASRRNCSPGGAAAQANLCATPRASSRKSPPTSAPLRGEEAAEESPAEVAGG